MPQWTPSAQYRLVAEANRAFYARNAELYERTEPMDERSRAILERDLDEATALLGEVPSQLRALDACGGTGWISEELLKRGFAVTICDVSPDLLAIFGAKITGHQASPSIVCSEIAEFLAADGPSYNLIVFASALHHLEDIESVLTLAFGRLAPSGLLLTCQDPAMVHSRLAKARLFLDYVLFKIIGQRADLGPSVRRKMRRIMNRFTIKETASEPLGEENLGVLAEYRVGGIDDRQLVEHLAKVGYQVVFHARNTFARSRAVLWCLNRLGYATHFRVLARHPGDDVHKHTPA